MEKEDLGSSQAGSIIAFSGPECSKRQLPTCQSSVTVGRSLTDLNGRSRVQKQHTEVIAVEGKISALSMLKGSLPDDWDLPHPDLPRTCAPSILA